MFGEQGIASERSFAQFAAALSAAPWVVALSNRHKRGADPAPSCGGELPIAAGEVGIVLGLEVSRLARDNADWRQLLRLAGITGTSTSAGKSWSATDGKSARACAAISSTPGYPAS